MSAERCERLQRSTAIHLNCCDAPVCFQPSHIVFVFRTVKSTRRPSVAHRRLLRLATLALVFVFSFELMYVFPNECPVLLASQLLAVLQAWFGKAPVDVADLVCRLCGRCLYLVTQVRVAPTESYIHQQQSRKLKGSSNETGGGGVHERAACVPKHYFGPSSCFTVRLVTFMRCVKSVLRRSPALNRAYDAPFEYVCRKKNEDTTYTHYIGRSCAKTTR